MNWRWFLTPAEPRAFFAFVVGACVFAGLFVMLPVVQGNLLVTLAGALVLTIVSIVVVKLIMVRLFK